MLPELRNVHPSRRDGRSGVYDLFHSAPAGYKRVLFESPVDVTFNTARVPFTESEHARFEAEKTVRWKAKTGLEPQDSHFTLIVPIRNEQALLRDSLAALSASDIPRDVHMQVILATNACTDGSAGIVEGFMDQLGEVQTGTFGDRLTAFDDEGLTDAYHVVQPRNSNITFMHIDTSTAGKANVLNIGNKMAREKNHDILICSDSDAFPEPDAVPYLFGDAHREIVEEHGALVLSANQKFSVSRTSRYRKIKQKLRGGIGLQEGSEVDENKIQRGYVSGALMAWDTKFVEGISGIPEVVKEDYALGIAALKVKEGGTKRVKEARVWHFKSTKLRDTIRERARSVQGMRQIMETGDYEEGIILEDRPIMNPLAERIAFYRSSIRPQDRGSLVAPMALGKMLFINEIARVQGNWAYRKNPKATTWNSTRSTRSKENF
jgi:cellulose synthase/poly-beta-1,6-N-acetylglucosamine synthase-like glycosyltransferase